MGSVEIMLWWLPPALVTLGAMLWVSWHGRERDDAPDRSEAAQARMAAALGRDLPRGARDDFPRPRDRSTGIAVRPSQAAGFTPPPTTPRAAEADERRSA